ncbi:MAG: hypothetical protein CGU28_04170 [Candidatus Dactylopiibacterium carminicum]|uniref:Putative tail fiber protein gp53-like C-terminal domain-containing protein n=1 Tax=Candidatus Dactylopiibacterium carminicum TaxID=857335 RepID=A0A272EXG7_9RHOO|nr:hypothetical protein BGI27_03665 [Candidatus Dactylopiibacterium carminicum]PAS94814.1 MAG: hypothetical protein CGU29_02635 [Candidatus Dactylopiibacterium carminicum]PAS97738.1 MAG: hypothetical protein CGU28_04170 [Candidatus Dactylopiibacterium carminicum]PAT00169.1 MAG: hypothetical protein BSR46_03695 [Candidatus Dactylopiibacterium carminicum]
MFVEEDVAAGRQPTVITAEFLNDLQEEICNAITAYLALDGASRTQLRQVLALKANLLSPALSGTPTAPTAAGDAATTQIANMAAVRGAMALFGLGQVSRQVTGDLNDLDKNGFYMGQSLANAPLNSTAWFYVLHQRHNASYASQTAWMFGLNATRVFFRQSSSGVWGAWVENALLDSPAFAGMPTAPTAAADAQTAQLANMAAVRGAMALFGVGNISAAATDLNEITLNGMYKAAGTALNTPLAQPVTVWHQRYDGNFSAQIAVSYSDGGRLFVRRTSAGTWQAWQEIATSAAVALKQDALGYTPVRQGTGVGQTTNTIHIGYSAEGKIKATVGVTDFGPIWTGSHAQLLTGANGYQKLPSGLIIQWGTIATATRPMESGFGTQTFSVAFPTACAGVVAQANSDAAVGLHDLFTQVGSISQSSFMLGTDSNTSGTDPRTFGVRWFAIGY